MQGDGEPTVADQRQVAVCSVANASDRAAHHHRGVHSERFPPCAKRDAEPVELSKACIPAGNVEACRSGDCIPMRECHFCSRSRHFRLPPGARSHGLGLDHPRWPSISGSVPGATLSPNRGFRRHGLRVPGAPRDQQQSPTQVAVAHTAFDGSVLGRRPRKWAAWTAPSVVGSSRRSGTQCVGPSDFRHVPPSAVVQQPFQTPGWDSELPAAVVTRDLQHHAGGDELQ